MTTQKNIAPLYWGGLFIGIVLSFIYAQHQWVMADQLQMLEKGYLGARAGIWLSYGNVASAMGNVPGSLSAWLIGLPLLLWDSPYSPMLLLLALRLLAFLLLDRMVRELFSPTVRLAFMLLFWLSPWFLYDSLLYNPAYLPLFAALHFWSAFQLREKGPFWSSFACSALHVIAIGMAMQLHYSWPLLAVISGYLFLMGRIRFNWFGILAGVALVGLSLWPYFHEMLINSSISREANPDAQARYIGWGLVHVYPIFKALIYWLRYSSWIFTTKLVNGVEFSAFAAVPWLHWLLIALWKVVIYAVGAASLWLVILANRYGWTQVRASLWRRRREQAETPRTWFALYGAAAVIAVIVCAALAPIVFSYWHLTLVFPFALFPLLLWLEHWSLGREHKVCRYLLWAACYCIAVNLVAAHDSRKFAYRYDYADQVNLYLQQHPVLKLHPASKE